MRATLYKLVRRTLLPAIAGCVLFAASPAVLRAQGIQGETTVGAVNQGATNNTGNVLDGVTIDQKNDAQVPADATFRDEDGNLVCLGDLFNKRPIILTLVYFKCPMLCTLELSDLKRAMQVLPLELGKDFDIVTISFDPREGPPLAAEKKAGYLRGYVHDGPTARAGWHFLTGDEANIRKVTQAVGFQYKYDPQYDQYIHTTGVCVLTPAGRVSRYFFGVDYSATDLRMGIAQAGQGVVQKPLPLVERVLLFCLHYDPHTGKYSVPITYALQIMGVLTVIGLIGLVGWGMRTGGSVPPAPGKAADADINFNDDGEDPDATLPKAGRGGSN